MTTIPLIVYGISRYAQLLYEREEGERPEKIVSNFSSLKGTFPSIAPEIMQFLEIAQEPRVHLRNGRLPGGMFVSMSSRFCCMGNRDFFYLA